MGEDYYSVRKQKKGSHWTHGERKLLDMLWNWPPGKDARAGTRDIGELAALFGNWRGDELRCWTVI
jgi:hypothetical protein